MKAENRTLEQSRRIYLAENAIALLIFSMVTGSFFYRNAQLAGGFACHVRAGWRISAAWMHDADRVAFLF